MSVLIEIIRNEAWRNIFLMDLITILIYSEDAFTERQQDEIDKLFIRAHKENKKDDYMATIYLLGEAQYRIQQSALHKAEKLLELCETRIEELESEEVEDKIEKANIVC
jgi:hypothetical protein